MEPNEQQLALLTPFSPTGWRETWVGGQSFAWALAGVGDGSVVVGQVGAYALRLRLGDGGRSLHWSGRGEGILPQGARAVSAYLGDEERYARALDTLPWRSDPVLARAMQAFGGLRLLAQPVEEVLFCFLCSSAKSIGQIRGLFLNVCREWGPACGVGLYSFPEWTALAEAGEDTLRRLKLGYRARFVAETARVATPAFFENLRAASYGEARRILMELPGVGEKIADCVCLFGLGHWEAFPVDTWIAKGMAELYGLDRWKLPDIAHFGRLHFGENAGLAQQFLFSWMRMGSKG